MWPTTYDAYFVFDADNRLDRHYVEMNKAFQSGFRILTSYRNSVNLADNWVSSVRPCGSSASRDS